MLSSFVVLPIPCTMIVIVPFSGSESAIVSGNPLAVGVQPKNDELAGFPLPGDAGRLDGEPLDIGREKLGLDNREHQGKPRESDVAMNEPGTANYRSRPSSARIGNSPPARNPSTLARVDYQKPRVRRNRK